MNLVEMSNDEWEEVRKHHDAMVQMGTLELQTEEIREHRPDKASRPGAERALEELNDTIVGISH
ncbi:MAG TPA: hypothetical protein VFP92_13325 [Rhodanobacteraceae bacterium]|nr:hypothetical protein [Rhodanobacteraceae bacterium]